jgi:pimeloyl-ACP methyl ester carboxylesterase
MDKAVFEPVSGGYLRVPLLGKPHRLYVEQAGQGIPLVCMHTANSDTRQYRGLMNDAQLLRDFRVIAFDMPYHGKSSPPAGWHQHEYKLHTRDYIQVALELCQALELDRPVLMGCSIGGRLVLHLALDHPERFSALIGVQANTYTQRGYDLDWMHRPDVNGGETNAGIVSGLIGPAASEADRWETLWHYMQGGPGVFKGDLRSYEMSAELRARIDEIDATRCPLYLLTGEYDYSCLERDTLELARRIKGAKASIMRGLGHFPMSENPELFLSHLRPVLAEILARARGEIPASASSATIGGSNSGAGIRS